MIQGHELDPMRQTLRLGVCMEVFIGTVPMLDA